MSDTLSCAAPEVLRQCHRIRISGADAFGDGQDCIAEGCR